MPASAKKTAFFIEAEKLRLAENYERAIPAYRAVLTEDPGDGEVRKTLAGLYLLTGNRAQGLAEYMLLMTQHLQDGELDKAEQLLRRVRNLDKEGRFRQKLDTLAQGLESARAAVPGASAAPAPSRVAPPAPPPVPRPAAPPEPVPSFQLEIEEGEPELPAGEPEAPAAASPSPRETSELRLATTAELDATPDITEDDLASAEADLRQEAADLSRSSAALSNVLFQELPPPVLNLLIRACAREPFERGAVIFEQGQSSRDVFIVGNGIVEVRARRPDQRIVGVAKLGPGEMFGEMGFLTGDPREATVVADSECLCFRLPAADADRLIAEHAELRAVVHRLYAQRVVPLFLATSSLFAGVPYPVREALLKGLELVQVPPGEVVVKEGSEGDDLYFVKKGEVRVVTSGPRGAVDLGVMGRHQLFGEIAFFTRGKRTASVIARTPCDLLRITGDRLRPIIAQHPPLMEALRQVQVEHATEAAKKILGK